MSTTPRLAFAALCAWGALASVADTPPPQSRVEARSADLVAVGVVHEDRMVIHLSRVSDNSPVQNAAVSVLLRGRLYPARAETDGSYTMQTPDLSLPGKAALEFQIVQGTAKESLDGELVTVAQGMTEDKNSSRQLWWWVLNFAVCIGFLRLWSQRRKAAAAREAASEE